MKFFSVDGPIYKFMSSFMQVFLLNLCFLVTSIPVVTIGASIVSMYDVMMRMVDNEEGYVVKQYFKAFKNNWKQGIPLGILNLIAVYAVYLDFALFNALEDPPIWVLIAGMLSAFYFLMIFLYAYPQVARYQNKLWIIMRNSFRIAIKYFGWTVLMVVVAALEIALFSWNVTLMFLGLLIGPGCVIYTLSAFMMIVFRKLEKEREEGDGNVE
ncbi:MAG: YesL family protein [Lachnospiraceae bacterium]|nr:YesL family protein [Lachnospiraceae bacterium]